jgi:hypothetical protein
MLQPPAGNDALGIPHGVVSIFEALLDVLILSGISDLFSGGQKL